MIDGGGGSGGGELSGIMGQGGLWYGRLHVSGK